MDTAERLQTLLETYHVLAKTQKEEIERLREALKEVDKALTAWMPEHSPMRQALQNFTRSALQQKESE